MINTPEPLFVESVGTDDERHTGEYIAELIFDVLRKYDPQKFLLVVADNASAMQKAGKIVKELYPHITMIGCTSHTLHLLIKDVIDCPSVKDHMGDVKYVISTIKNSHLLKASLKKINADLPQHLRSSVSLHTPGETRWGSNLRSLDSLRENKIGLRMLAVKETINIPNELQVLLLSPSFWNKIEHLADIMRPIVKWTIELESDEPKIHQAVRAFHEIEYVLDAVLPGTFLKDDEKEYIFESAKYRNEFSLKKIHYSAFLLDPANELEDRDSKQPNERNLPKAQLSDQQNSEAIEFLLETAHFMRNVDPDAVLLDITKYSCKLDAWSHKFSWKVANKIHPKTWWATFFKNTDLSKVAQRIFSMPTTSAATERSFSTYGRIHSKGRHRLTLPRAGKLCFIAHNWKLTSKLSIKLMHSNQDLREAFQKKNIDQISGVVYSDESCDSEEDEIPDKVAEDNANVQNNRNI